MGAGRENLLAALMLLGSGGFFFSQLQPRTAVPVTSMAAQADPHGARATSNFSPQTRESEAEEPRLDGSSRLALDAPSFSVGAGKLEPTQYELVVHLANHGTSTVRYTEGTDHITVIEAISAAVNTAPEELTVTSMPHGNPILSFKDPGVFDDVPLLAGRRSLHVNVGISWNDAAPDDAVTGKDGTSDDATCAAWECSCQVLSDRYGISPGLWGQLKWPDGGSRDGDDAHRPQREWWMAQNDRAGCLTTHDHRSQVIDHIDHDAAAHPSRPSPPAPCPALRPPRRRAAAATGGVTVGVRILPGVVAATHGSEQSPLLPRVPRVMVASIGTGRYREFAKNALESGLQFLGGDCEPSFHLLTDNISGIAANLNPQFVPYRPWPESGLSKYEDMLGTLGDMITAEADYFFFMDADVLFNEPVRLMDIAGDLVGVEHPMYPRDNYGWCYREDGQPMCAFPYDRNPKSHAYIPDHVGKFIHKTVGGHGVVRKYLTSNFWYLQSAFWGGKKTHITEMLAELADRVDIDRRENRYSQTVQDERYFNYWIWRQSSNASKNIRILSHSFLYPYRSDGFGEWVTKKHRPIIYHGTKVPGKLSLGEVDIAVIKTNQCLGYFLNPLVGLFGCHHGGGMQGWIVETAEGAPSEWPPAEGAAVRFRQATTNHKWSQCLSGDVAPGSPAKLPICRGADAGVLWVHDGDGRLVNEKTKLCIDAVTKPPHRREPLKVSACSDSEFQRWRITVIGSVECKQKWCQKAGDTPHLSAMLNANPNH